MKRWWLDELSHAGPEHLDSEYVAGYERKAGFDASEDIEELKALGLNRDSVVVDMGAGTGTFAIAVARLCDRVIAVDVSPAMNAALSTRLVDERIKNVELVNGGFLSYEHAGEPVDFVFTRNAMHQLPDFWKGIALQRLSELLRPGGVLRLRDLVFDFDARDADANIDAWLDGAVTDSSAGWTAEELAEHVRTEFSTYSWLLEPMLERAGFEIVNRAFRRGVYGAYTCRLRG